MPIKAKVSKSKKDTDDIAKTFLTEILPKKDAKKPKGALVVGLSGHLGAGKTAFVKAVARHLGIKATVNSPTFVIIKKYPIKRLGAHKTLVHMDAYRLKNERELKVLGWKDILKDPTHLVFVEWPENIRRSMPRQARHIDISHTKTGHREIKFR